MRNVAWYRELDVDAKVATYWPEFGEAGKQDVTVRMVLSHQAGLPWATEIGPPWPRGEVAGAGISDDGTAKAAMNHMVKELARVAGPKNVRVNAIAPGYIDTEMLANADPGVRKELLRRIPVGRFGSAEEIQRRVRFHNTGPEQTPGLLVMSIGGEHDASAAFANTGCRIEDAGHIQASPHIARLGPCGLAVFIVIDVWGLMDSQLGDQAGEDGH